MSEVIVSFKRKVDKIKAYSDLYCNEDGYPIVFRCRQDAVEHLKRDGVTDEQMSKMWFVSCIGRCFRCGGPLFPSFLPDYTSHVLTAMKIFTELSRKQRLRSHFYGL